MTAASKALAIFLRYPEAGRVKSRLASGLGKERALRIYLKLLRRTLGIASDFKKSRPELDIILFFTPSEKKLEMINSFPGPWKFSAQHGTHLGERMSRAIEQTLTAGYRQIVLIGTDVTDLQVSDFEEAFRSIDEGYAVLNPAEDGGFYLIGLNRPCPSALISDQWGSPEVFKRTRDLLSRAGFEVRSGKKRKDIDRPEDVQFFSEQPFMREKLSVIIPTRKPIENLSPTLNMLEKELWPSDEIVVSTSESGSSPAVKQMDVIGDHLRVVHSLIGRGIQLNHGASVATGNLFWFLHDDCIPANQFAYHIRKLSISPRHSLGCFLLEFSPSNRGLDLVARWANFRSLHLKRPYGDQGLFCRAEVFRHLKGFQKAFLMEDVDFVHRAKELGNLLVIHEKLFTSPERYMNKGIWRASMENHLTMLRYLTGMEDHKLFARYYGVSIPPR